MADIDLSLDEIIKKNKIQASREKAKGGIRGKFPKKTAGVAGRNRLRGATTVPAKRQQFVRRSGFSPSKPGNSINSQIVKKLVNNAVRRELARGRAASGTPRRAGGAIPRNIVTNTSRMAGVSQRSRVIQRSRPVSAVQQVIRSRGRGFGNRQPAFGNRQAPFGGRQAAFGGRQGTMFSDVIEEVVRPAPVRFIRQPAVRPAQQVVHVVERVPARPRFRQVQQPVIQRVARGSIMRRASLPVQRVIQQSQPVMQRVIRRPQAVKQIVYEDAAPIQQQRVRVVRPQMIRQQVQQVRRVQQPIQARRNRNVQYIEYVDEQPGTSRANQRQMKNSQMRNALGLNTAGRQVIREAPRFESSNSFLGRRTVVVKRGRGFNNF